MTFQMPKSTFAETGAFTLGDVLTRIVSAGDLSDRQRREMSSAINTAARWLHSTPAAIPANPLYLNRVFGRLNFGTLGVSRARMRNVKSLLIKALAAAGVANSARSYPAELRPDWKALKQKIGNPYYRDCLNRFVRFCSARGIAPSAVDDVTVQMFRAALITEGSTPRPEVSAQSAVRIWNRLVVEVPGWPDNLLTPLCRFKGYSLEWKEMPNDLVREVENYLDIMAGRYPMHELAPARPFKPHSIRKRRYELRQFISALHHRGENIFELHTLADLCDPKHVKSVLQFFIDRHLGQHGDESDPASSTMIGGIADAIRSLAKYYVQAPEPVVTELTRIAKKFRRRGAGMTEKNRHRLAQLDAELERRLICYPFAELQKLAGKSHPTRKDAVRFGQILALELLILAPMRIENIAGLDLERHFVSLHRRKDVRIVIPRDAVKNDTPLDYIIPESSAKLLFLYLDRFRPLLCTAPSTAVFPGYRGRPKRSDTLSKQLSKLIRTELGFEWNPHLFRHFAARLYLRAHPGDYEGARRILGHRSIETTAKFYEGMEMQPAVERYDAIIESVRGQSKASPRLRSGRRRAAQSKRD